MSAHSVGLLVWGVIAGVLLVLGVLSETARVPMVRLGQLVDTAMQRPLVRVVVVVGWMWLGWHTFAR